MELRDLLSSPLQKRYVEACLLATSNLPEVAELLEVPVEVLVEYERDHFPYGRLTRLAKLEYLDSIEDPQEKQLKLWAVTQGFNFIKWRLGFDVEISPIEGVKTLYADSIYKAKEAFFNHNDTNSSKEALRWVNQATFLAKMLKAWVADNKEAMADIELALEKLDGSNVEFPTIESVDDTPELLSDDKQFKELEAEMNSIQDSQGASLSLYPEESKVVGAKDKKKRKKDWELNGG